ncbi:hypothetical protein HMPREF3113_11285 [Stenotrophomonas sp. HMSC10F06]|uniref:hypothetical protein n=1 Tax=Stenotrophomonas sp. HMSC10F06 TaxID=1581081 RepID=UPI0008A4921A|nr:hypothetical protein [Stenotrophomonas sp. HMSC10F06]OFS93304.1 hypothetical protein HMPREF3113_11285 [Stenotrophomonas sp. HMSC10F06]
MGIYDELKDALEAEERRSVGDSFGGEGVRSVFSLDPAYQSLMIGVADYPSDPLGVLMADLARQVHDARLFRWMIFDAMRFAFLIELTNIRVSSTKTKTRWMPVPTSPNTSTSFGSTPPFDQAHDPRASSYAECYEMFEGVLVLLLNDLEFRATALTLAGRNGEWTYPLTYQVEDAAHIHTGSNIRRADLTDLNWLLKVEGILMQAPSFGVAPVLDMDTVKKIRTKAYRTDRAQTGTTQTNRAKRWEASYRDYQYANVESCWSVERALLQSLADFSGFPSQARALLVAQGLAPATWTMQRCPVTLQVHAFADFTAQMSIGRSDFHVGHLHPLKAGGRHVGSNVAWLSRDGNRIQGDLSLGDAHSLIRTIAHRLDNP